MTREGSPSELEEFKYKKVFQSSPDPIMMLEVKNGMPTRYLDVNDAYASQLGYSREECLKINPYDVMPEAFHKNLPRMMETLYQDKKVSYEVSRITKNGLNIPVEVNIILFTSLSNDHDVMLVLSHDIRERKQLQNELLEVQFLFKMLFENAIDSITMVELSEERIVEKFIDVNPTFCERVGFTREELLNMTPLDILPPEARSNLPKIDKMLREKSVAIFETEEISKDGRIIPVELSIHLLRVGDRDVGLTIGRDITIRNQIEKELRDTETQRAKFEAMVSHELRTPLTAILGFSEIIENQKEKLDAETLTTCVDSIKKSVKRLATLADTIIDVSEVEHGVFNLNLEPIDFYWFMNELQETYKHVGIKFFSNIPKDVVFINIDTPKLRKVFDIILKNAIRQTSHTNRSITVNTQLTDISLIVKILDNGVGISSENLDIIFEKFKSIPTEVAVDGIGVDLYLARHIIFGHGGSLTAESEGIGKGASFIIHLPREK